MAVVVGQATLSPQTLRQQRTIEDVEVATAQWVDWCNHRRLYEYCGDMPPAELETAYYAQHRRPAAG
jgi:putative transposase